MVGNGTVCRSLLSWFSLKLRSEKRTETVQECAQKHFLCFFNKGRKGDKKYLSSLGENRGGGSTAVAVT